MFRSQPLDRLGGERLRIQHSSLGVVADDLAEEFVEDARVDDYRGEQVGGEGQRVDAESEAVRTDLASFITVVPAGERRRREPPAPPAGIPEPERVVSEEEATIRFMGVGGTGVVTLAQVVGMAAILDGKQVRGLDRPNTTSTEPTCAACGP